MPITHKVKPGETLWGIAEKYLGKGARWKEITGYTGVPEKLPIGTVLTIPEAEKVAPPTEPSVAEYLKSIGAASTPEAIRTLYEADPIRVRKYGAYTGTPEQQTALIEYLKTKEVPTKPVIVPPVEEAPPAEKPGAYKLKWGDTLSALAARFGTTVDAIMAANVGNPAIKTRDLIYAGMTINIPGAPAVELEEKITEGVEGVVETSKEARRREEEEEEVKREKEEELTEEQQREIERLRRQKELEDLRVELGLEKETGLKKPPLPTFEDDFAALRSEHGVDALESQINTIEKDIRDIEAALRAGLYTEEGKLRPVELISKRQRELRRQTQEDLDTLNRRKQTLVDELSTKTTLINNIMNLKEADYTVAKNDYNTSFSQQIQLLNILEGRRTKAEQEANRVRDDSRANLDILTNLITTTGKTWDELDLNMKTQIQNLELKAELPSGVIEAYLKEKPDAELMSTVTGTDAAGNQVVTFIYKDEKGMPGIVKTVTTGARAAAEAKFTSTQLNKGMTEAGMTKEEFLGLDELSQRIFVFGDIAGAKEDITAELERRTAKDLLKTEIDGMDIPDSVKAILNKYLETEATRIERRRTTRTPEITDDVIRAEIRAEIGALQTKQDIRDKIVRDVDLTDADKERYYLILDEMMPEEKPKEKKERKWYKPWTWF